MFLTGAEGFQKFARGVFYVFISIFPFLLYKGFIFNGSSTRSINLIIVIEILVICLTFALFQNKNKLGVSKSPITIALLAVFASLFISSLLGIDFAASFWSKVTRMSGLFYFLHLGLFYFFIMMLFRGEDKMRKLIKVFLVSSGIFSIGSLLAKDGLGLIFANREWQGFTFGNSTFAAMYLFAAFILSIYYVYSMNKESCRWWHRLIPLVFIANPYFINADVWRGNVNVLQDPLAVLGGAQASSYALIVSVALLLVFWGISKIKDLKIRRGVIWGTVALGLVFSVFAVYSLLSPTGFIQQAYLKQASSSRPLVWALSGEAIAEKPAFGWGTDNFDRAFESHYDNQIMEKAKGGEAWFDRAHNVFIDQGVENGYVGVAIYVLAYLTIIGSMLYVIFRSVNKTDQAFAVFIIVYFLGHLMELQTAFDTTISYIPLTIMAGFAAIIFHRTYSTRAGIKSEWVVPQSLQYAFGAGLILASAALFFIGTVPIIKAQSANGTVRTVGSSDKRIPLYPKIFGSPVDTAGFLNRTVTDLQRGISLDPSILQKPGQAEGFKKELEVFVVEYQEYLESHPDDYRARIKLTDLYIYQRLFEVNNLDLAHENADKAILISPDIPQAYWQKSVAYLYQRKFPEAKEWAKKAHDLNPNIEQSQHLIKYIEESIKTFPNIELYNFLML